MAGPFQGSDLNPALNKSGQPGPTPNTYRKHQRYERFARLKIGKDQLSAFLIATAARLSSTTSVIFTKLSKYGAARVKAATSLGQLP